MTEQDFLRRMKEDILDTEAEMTLDTVLEELDGWDSLGFVSFIAMAKAAGGQQVDAATVGAAKTLRDLFAYVR